VDLGMVCWCWGRLTNLPSAAKHLLHLFCSKRSFSVKNLKLKTVEELNCKCSLVVLLILQITVYSQSC